MAANKAAERFATFSLLMPTGVAIASGQPLILGRTQAGLTHYAAGVAIEAQPSTLTGNVPYDNESGYLTVDFEGAYNLTVVAETLGSPSAGAAINTGDAIYASGGTYDPVSGISYGFTLCKDTTGDFFGLALAPVAAGTTQVIAVLLKNAA
jgi:hypothetical protein